jgi:hypothetical protein
MDDHLFAEVKRVAASSGRTFTAVIEDAVRALLSNEQRSAAPTRPSLPVDEGGELLPGVDLDDSAALLDLMDARTGPS